MINCCTQNAGSRNCQQHIAIRIHTASAQRNNCLLYRITAEINSVRILSPFCHSGKTFLLQAKPAIKHNVWEKQINSPFKISQIRNRNKQNHQHCRHFSVQLNIFPVIPGQHPQIKHHPRANHRTEKWRQCWWFCLFRLRIWDILNGEFICFSHTLCFIAGLA